MFLIRCAVNPSKSMNPAIKPAACMNFPVSCKFHRTGFGNLNICSSLFHSQIDFFQGGDLLSETAESG